MKEENAPQNLIIVGFFRRYFHSEGVGQVLKRGEFAEDFSLSKSGKNNILIFILRNILLIYQLTLLEQQVELSLFEDVEVVVLFALHLYLETFRCCFSHKIDLQILH